MKRERYFGFNSIQDGHFRGCSLMVGVKKAPIAKICHTYPTMMKLGKVIPYLKKIKKYMIHVTQPLISAFFHRKSANFVISNNKDTDCILLCNL